MGRKAGRVSALRARSKKSAEMDRHTIDNHLATAARQRGFTLLELLIGVAILALIVAVAIPSYQEYRLKAQIAQSISDLVAISAKIDEFYVDNKRYPDSLSDVSLDAKTDPWGNTYRYLEISSAGNNEPRQDRNLRPVNTDYDLYSMGPNGNTHRVFTSNKGKDDVVRANNGEYFGVASDY